MDILSITMYLQRKASEQQERTYWKFCGSFPVKFRQNF